jgi:catechol 2,3-dioxygenase-like lactoylglutathione lyase family enzyme
MTTMMRPLHWVIKSKDLKETITFYESVLGLKVLRHEEFLEGCEATCNGRYHGAWSKTILGKTSENVNFCLEIVFNWGIENYFPRGNGYRSLKVQDDLNGTKSKAAQGWWTLHHNDTGKRFENDSITEDPDGNRIEFLPAPKVTTVTTTRTGYEEEQFVALELGVKDLNKSLQYYKDVFKARSVGETFFSTGDGLPTQRIQFGEGGTCIDLVEIKQDIDHGAAQGRFAVETENGEPDALAKRAGPDQVIHG